MGSTSTFRVDRTEEDFRKLQHCLLDSLFQRQGLIHLLVWLPEGSPERRGHRPVNSGISQAMKHLFTHSLHLGHLLAGGENVAGLVGRVEGDD